MLFKKKSKNPVSQAASCHTDASPVNYRIARTAAGGQSPPTHQSANTMGCGSSSLNNETEHTLRSSSHQKEPDHHRGPERERQRNLAINRERPMAWLFQYPDPCVPPPSKAKSFSSSSSSQGYSSTNSSALSSQNSGTSAASATENKDIDPWLPGPNLRPLHVGHGKSRR